jgi:hypothetical protein
VTIRLRASDHTYWTGAGASWRRVPGVNEIIRAAIPQAERWFTPESRERGNLVHEALALHLSPAGLDWSSLREDITPYIHAGVEALRAAKAVPTLVEEILYDSVLDFAGRPDFVGYLFEPSELSVEDHKSGAVPKAAGLATAGYSILASRALGKRPTGRQALKLQPDQSPTFRFIDLTQQKDAHLDERRFLEALDLYRAYSFREDRIGENYVEPFRPDGD